MLPNQIHSVRLCQDNLEQKSLGWQNFISPKKQPTRSEMTDTAEHSEHLARTYFPILSRVPNASIGIVMVHPSLKQLTIK